MISRAPLSVLLGDQVREREGAGVKGAGDRAWAAGSRSPTPSKLLLKRPAIRGIPRGLKLYIKASIHGLLTKFFV